MRFDALGDVNWLAVIVATVVYFVLGAVWYARPVFGAAWQRSMGWSMPEGQRPPPGVMIAPALTSLVSTAALAALAVATGTDTVAEGIVLGLFVGVGFAIATLFVTAIFEPTKPARMTWFAITAGYHFTGLLIASVIIAVWR